MSFTTVINCMDGRTQEPAIEYLKKRFSAKYVDSVTEPGPVKILAEKAPENLLNSIYNRLDISVNHHGSKSITVVAHYDCAGNPLPKEKQIIQLHSAADLLKEKYPKVEIIKIWIGEGWKVEEID